MRFLSYQNMKKIDILLILLIILMPMSVFSKSIDDEDLFLNLQEIDLSSIQTVKLMMEDVVSEKKDSVASYYYVEVDRTQNIFDVTIYKE